MTKQYVAFDIEIAKSLPGDFSDWKMHRPLGITCAAFAWLDEQGTPTARHVAARDPQSGDYTPSMSVDQVASIVSDLQAFTQRGYTIVTWNGLSFDFDILAEESNRIDDCRQLARNHADMMYHFLCLKGFPLSLDAAAKGMKLAGKSAGVDGAMAPRMWANGEFQQVLDYVEQDAITTLELALAIETHRQLHWQSKRGKWLQVRMSKGLLTVEQATELPEPDTSWMSAPLKRADFRAWLA